MTRTIEFRAKISKSGDRYLIKIPAKLEHLIKPVHEKRTWVIVRIEIHDNGGAPPS